MLERENYSHTTHYIVYAPILIFELGIVGFSLNIEKLKPINYYDFALKSSIQDL
jgi:hypothetical protein